jgi:hypothetical protein
MNITITDFLTNEEIKKAVHLKTATLIRDNIIEPNIDRINKSLGQENDPMYLAYAVEYVLTRAKK